MDGQQHNVSIPCCLLVWLDECQLLKSILNLHIHTCYFSFSRPRPSWSHKKRNSCCLPEVYMLILSSFVPFLTFRFPSKPWKVINVYKHLFDLRYFIIGNWWLFMQIITQKAVKWMIVTNINKPNQFQRRFGPNSSSPKLPPQIEPIQLFTQTSGWIITQAGWPMSTPHSMDKTFAETLRVIWCRLIRVGKRLVIKSQVHVFTDSFVTISRCCLQRCMQGEHFRSDPRGPGA